MNILFVHQSFPGQYRHIIKALALQGGHTIVGLGVNNLSEEIPSSVVYIKYPLLRGNINDVPEFLTDMDSKIIRAESCAEAAFKLKTQGFKPDLICAHPGWGEVLFIKDVWPQIPLLCYQEFFYNAFGFDYDFDSEFQSQSFDDWRYTARLVTKNANPLLSLHYSDWNITPTQFQLSCFPSIYHSKFSVIHDGIDTSLASPNSSLKKLQLKSGATLTKEDQVITFVNRSLEPYRGCHSFIRAIPTLLERNKSSHIVVVGNQTGVSYGSGPANTTWKSIFLSEIEGSYDPSRVTFTDWLSYPDFINLLQLSACHVYLTYPFVLSWSLLEAMSIGVPIVASSTAPVKELIIHEQNGLLFDFFSTSELCEAVTRVLSDSDLSSHISNNAQTLIRTQYSLEQCIPSHLSLMQLVAQKALGY